MGSGGFDTILVNPYYKYAVSATKSSGDVYVENCTVTVTSSDTVTVSKTFTFTITPTISISALSNITYIDDINVTDANITCTITGTSGRVRIYGNNYGSGYYSIAPIDNSGSTLQMSWSSSISTNSNSFTASVDGSTITFSSISLNVTAILTCVYNGSSSASSGEIAQGVTFGVTDEWLADAGGAISFDMVLGGNFIVSMNAIYGNV